MILTEGRWQVAFGWIGDSYSGGNSTFLAAITGFSNLTVPAGNISGLPVGISFIGGNFQEGALIKLAYAYEQTTNHRKTPQFIPSIQLE